MNGVNGMTGAQPLSARDTELLAAPPIASQMPVLMPNGARWERMVGQCAGCQKPVDGGLLTGLVSRPIATVAVVDAVGRCLECGLVTRFFYRLHDDMRLTSRDARGRWVTWNLRLSKQPRWRKQLRAVVRFLFW